MPLDGVHMGFAKALLAGRDREFLCGDRFGNPIVGRQDQTQNLIAVCDERIVRGQARLGAREGLALPLFGGSDLVQIKVHAGQVVQGRRGRAMIEPHDRDAVFDAALHHG